MGEGPAGGLSHTSTSNTTSTNAWFTTTGASGSSVVSVASVGATRDDGRLVQRCLLLVIFSTDHKIGVVGSSIHVE